jgi:hypothetical protein
MTTEYELYRTADEAYVVRDGDREVVEMRPAEPNWWDARRLPDGVKRHMFEPHDGTEESEREAAARVAIRLL